MVYPPAKEFCGEGTIYFPENRVIESPAILERMGSAAISIASSQISRTPS